MACCRVDVTEVSLATSTSGIAFAPPITYNNIPNVNKTDLTDITLLDIVFGLKPFFKWQSYALIKCCFLHLDLYMWNEWLWSMSPVSNIREFNLITVSISNEYYYA